MKFHLEILQKQEEEWSNRFFNKEETIEDFSFELDALNCLEYPKNKIADFPSHTNKII